MVDILLVNLWERMLLEVVLETLMDLLLDYSLGDDNLHRHCQHQYTPIGNKSDLSYNAQ